VRKPDTTICCSALALTLVLAHPVASQPTLVPILPARQQWTLPLNNALTTAPGFNGAHGYFPIEGDRLVAYDLTSGRQLWLVAAQPGQPLVASDQHVFVVTPNAIVALRVADGSEAWRTPIDEPLAVRPVWGNGWLIAATASGTVLALRASDGEILWRHDTGARVTATPAIGADRIYVPLEDRRVLAVDVSDGSVVWERRVGGPPTDILALDDRIYVGATDNFLYAINAQRGEVAWRWRTGADVIGAPVADDDRVYFVSLDNILRALGRKGGSQAWKRSLPIRPRGGPLLVGSTLIVGGLAPAVRGYAVATGTPAGEATLPADLAAPPHVFLNDGVPMLIAVISDIVNGATVMAFIPAIGLPSPFSPLPNQPTAPPPLP
jgi:outer membrane protein assembly factor BamB